MQFNPQNFFYHGTINIFSELIKDTGIKITARQNNGVDFGPGFYLTTNFHQAAKWAKDRAIFSPVPSKEILQLLQMDTREFLSNKEEYRPSILKYQIKDEENWLDLNNKIFTKESINWKEHVWCWRTAEMPPEKWEWTYGPVADGGLGRTDYHSIRAHPHMDQLAVHNEMIANSLLQLTEVIPC